MNLRLAILSLASLALVSTQLFAETGHGVLTAPAALTISGKPPRPLEAGQALTVLGTKSATQEVIVRVEASGETLVGILPSAAVTMVDGPVSQASAPASPAPATALPPVPSAPAAPALNLTAPIPALDIASLFETRREEGAALLTGRTIKIQGVLEKAELGTVAGGQRVPMLYFQTAKGLPRVKVQLSPNVSADGRFYQQFRNLLPDWWWGYSSNRSVEFRSSGLDSVEARAVYNSTYRSTTSEGNTYRSKSKSNSAWFKIFSPGARLQVEAVYEGIHVDVEFQSGLIVTDSQN